MRFIDFERWDAFSLKIAVKDVEQQEAAERWVAKLKEHGLSVCFVSGWGASDAWSALSNGGYISVSSTSPGALLPVLRAVRTASENVSFESFVAALMDQMEEREEREDCDV